MHVQFYKSYHIQFINLDNCSPLIFHIYFLQHQILFQVEYGDYLNAISFFFLGAQHEMLNHVVISEQNIIQIIKPCQTINIHRVVKRDKSLIGESKDSILYVNGRMKSHEDIRDNEYAFIMGKDAWLKEGNKISLS